MTEREVTPVDLLRVRRAAGYAAQSSGSAISAAALVHALGELEHVIGTGEEPDGLCGNRDDHRPHLHDSPTLGRFWCTADQDQREPHRSERRRREM